MTYANQKGDERTITIKGIDEADNQKGEVSWIAPIARALLKARVGDEVVLQTPGGVERIEVVEVNYPRPPRARGFDARHAQHGGLALQGAHHLGRCSRSRTESSSRSSLVSEARSSPMSMWVMSASAEATAEATSASTPLAVLQRDGDAGLERRTGCSAHSTVIQRSLSRSNRRLPTLQSAVCTVRPSPRPR